MQREGRADDPVSMTPDMVKCCETEARQCLADWGVSGCEFDEFLRDRCAHHFEEVASVAGARLYAVNEAMLILAADWSLAGYGGRHYAARGDHAARTHWRNVAREELRQVTATFQEQGWTAVVDRYAATRDPDTGIMTVHSLTPGDWLKRVRAHVRCSSCGELFGGGYGENGDAGVTRRGLRRGEASCRCGQVVTFLTF